QPAGLLVASISRSSLRVNPIGGPAAVKSEAHTSCDQYAGTPHRGGGGSPAHGHGEIPQGGPDGSGAKPASTAPARSGRRSVGRFAVHDHEDRFSLSALRLGYLLPGSPRHARIEKRLDETARLVHDLAIPLHGRRRHGPVVEHLETPPHAPRVVDGEL